MSRNQLNKKHKDNFFLKSPFWNGGGRISKTDFFIKAVRTLTTLTNINFFRNLEMNQRLAIIQGAFLKAKQPSFHRNSEMCGILIVLFPLSSPKLKLTVNSLFPWGDRQKQWHCFCLILQFPNTTATWGDDDNRKK